MKVALDNIGKRFNQEWIFRGVSLNFTTPNSYVITGTNGSGKSTLLQVISSASHLSEGKIIYSIEDKEVNTEEIYKYVSIAAPYMELIEEYRLEELVHFHSRFKPYLKNKTPNEVIEIMQLEKVKKRYIKQYSSGMKQRVKLALAILSDTPLLLLDEPCSNLDKQGIEWYKNMITQYANNRIVIVCSNLIKDEYYFCNHSIELSTYKI
ncbi:MAG: ATP-binding cassette domain-containing protein [Bacteroidetes bacterium]|nr:ATP-binding cassette domain-containing protein [Bacteroidota bacterium]MBV6462464.1 Vitamin B12 import ATP-binding protein BtuD [Flavobacteriales bacterium]WKZ74369.1 MAG: ATP-binding cassette domain-containing protein [Vicingaceae bacterium]MCL4817010.1 ATP-binding cassette domain-containing protein [Flavobacteriales bacterium]NOG94689.1 ATP-binding cassette domain-containing protein [Bacteroidota bacterium]